MPERWIMLTVVMLNLIVNSIVDVLRQCELSDVRGEPEGQ